MKIYALAVILCADANHKNPFLLTSKDNDNILPLIEIEHPKYFHKEIIHQIKSIFTTDSIKVSSECSYNFLDIQNDMTVQYVLDNYDFITENDLIITYGGILLKYICSDNFQWSPYMLNEQHKGYSSDMNLNLLLDYVIQRTSL